MNNAMESWIEGASRRAMHIGAVLLLLCLTLSSSRPTPTFNAADVVSSRQALPETHEPSTQSTELAKGEITKNVVHNKAVNISVVERNNIILSTVQTSVEDNRISTRMRRMIGEGFRKYESDVLKQLYSRTGYWLAIYDNETIHGARNRSDPYTHLRITTPSFGRVKIQGVLSGMYVCMNRHGKLFPSPVHTHECTFEERFLKTFYTVFSSDHHPVGGKKKWYIGLNADGRTRLGNKTKIRHQMAQFLLVSIEDS